MQRKNRLAVFEHVPPKERPSTTIKPDAKPFKRLRSPEPTIEDQSKTKRRRKLVNVSDCGYEFNCEIGTCSYIGNKYNEFLKHIELHLNEIEYCPDEIGYECIWSSCEESFDTFNSFRQHVLYHGYYHKLRQVAFSLLETTKLPDCNEPVIKLPALPPYYVCEWDNCGTIVATYQKFLDHVKCHVNGTPKSEKYNCIKCEWTGCAYTFNKQYKLADHMKSHTKEKSAVCPTCNVAFSSRTKFYDHRKRQLATDLQGYQCSQCSKLFASERLLRDHMRIHINHYKCHLCDMTCTKPSSLAKHIRYRHLPDRMFKCEICSHSTITQQDLNQHIATHSADNKMECPYCNYKCRSKFTINKHIKQHEGTWSYNYACHCCDKRFARGALLTKHLIKIHGFHWPSGHSRFSYKQNNRTGFFHLQVVRYESLEVTQEMMDGNIPYQFASGQNCKFECEQLPNKPLAYILKVSDDTNQHPNLSYKQPPQETNTKNKRPVDDVEITIEELDFEGNIIKIEKVESHILYSSQISPGDVKIIE